MLSSKSKAAPKETDEEYASRLADLACKSFTVHLLSIGLQLDIFKVLEQINAPVTYTQLAEKAGLKPRYVKEWCCGMVTGDVMDYDSDNQTFYLSPSRLKSLKSISVMAQFSVDTFNTRNILLECMKKDGPKGFVPWEYGNFSWRMQKQRELWLNEKDSVKQFVGVVPGLQENLENGIKVCEVGSNYGSVLLQMARLYPNSSFVGYDICEEVCVKANETAKQLNIKNIVFEAQDLYHFPSSLHNSFDYVFVFDVVHDVGDPRECIQCVQTILKPNNYLSIVDVRIHSDLKDNIDNPKISYIYPVSIAYCLGNSMHNGGEGAGAGYGMENICRDVKQTGLEVVSMQPLPYVDVLNHTVCLKPNH